MELLNVIGFRDTRFRILLVVFTLMLLIPMTITNSFNFRDNGLNTIENSLSESLNQKSEEIKQSALHNSNDIYNYSEIDIWNDNPFVEVRSIEVEDDWIFLTDVSGFISINISNKSEPIISSKTEHLEVNRLEKVEIDNNLAYLGFIIENSFKWEIQKIEIYNISNPENPIYLTSFFYYNIIDFFVNSSYMFILSEYDGLLIFDFSDPFNYHLVGQYENIIYGENMQIVEDYIYILNRYNDITIIDISNLVNPIKIYEMVYLESVESFFVHKTILYLTDRQNLTIYDISNPNNPSFRSKIDHQTYYGQIKGYNNGYLYLTPNYVYSIYIIDVSNPYIPTYVDRFSSNDHNIDGFWDIDFSNNTVAFACGRDGFLLGNITNDYNFIEISRTNTEYFQSALFYENCLIVSGNDKLSVLNVSDYYNLSVITEYRLQDTFVDFCVEYDRGYVLTSSNIQILNLTDIYNITKIGELSIPHHRMCLTVNNSIIYTGYTDMYVFNATNATNVLQIYKTNFNIYNIKSIVIYDNYIIAAWEYYGYYIFNKTDLQSIELISIFNPEMFATEFVISDGILYAIERDWIIYSYNISDILNIELISYTQQYDYEDLRDLMIINGSIYYVSIDKYARFGVLDNSNPLNLQLEILFWKEMNHNYYSIGRYNFAVDNGTVFLPLYNKGLAILGEDHDSDQISTYQETTKYLTNPYNIDSDSDLMSDYFEITYNLDPLNSFDANLDLDLDTLSNLEEYNYNLNPIRSDTDRDTLTDNLELSVYNTDPSTIDTDDDYLVDPFELFISFTSPILNDTDSDQLWDYSEIFYFSTDPLDVDTDDDLMDDYFEVIYLLDPLDPTDADGDLDLDGLTNYEEYLLGTAPNRSDSDYDGYSDYEEVQEGTDPTDHDDHPDYTKTPPTTNISLPSLITTTVGLIFAWILIYIRKKKRRLKC